MIRHNGVPRLSVQPDPPAALVPPAWTERATCRWVSDPDIFFPAPGATKERVEAVTLMYCRHCPVRRECADFADRNGEVGIWGGRLRSSQASKRTA